MGPRSPRRVETFGALDSGETPVIINDHDPNPLYHRLTAEVESFDPEGYTVNRVGPNEFTATLPKR